ASEGNVGIGFAIPSNTVKSVVAQIIRNGKVEHAYIGISARGITPELARVFRLPVSEGLLVDGVEPGSGAAKAGVRAGTTNVVLAGESYTLGGDVIVRADGIPLRSVERLRDLVAAKEPGDRMVLEIVRGGKRLKLHIKLGRQPSSLRE